MEPATIRLVAQCLNQMLPRRPPLQYLYYLTLSLTKVTINENIMSDF